MEYDRVIYIRYFAENYENFEVTLMLKFFILNCNRTKLLSHVLVTDNFYLECR